MCVEFVFFIFCCEGVWVKEGSKCRFLFDCFRIWKCFYVGNFVLVFLECREVVCLFCWY